MTDSHDLSLDDLDFRARLREKQDADPPAKKSIFQEIINHLAGAYTPEGMVLWFSRPRTVLGGRTPAQAIDDGDLQAVLDSIKSLDNCGGT